jgi:hypothetical protein
MKTTSGCKIHQRTLREGFAYIRVNLPPSAVAKSQICTLETFFRSCKTPTQP